jgi:hypothetical protein
MTASVTMPLSASLSYAPIPPLQHVFAQHQQYQQQQQQQQQQAQERSPVSPQQQQFSPMDRVLYNLHYQLSTAALRRSSTRLRSLAESLLLLYAICTFGALWIAHISFVYDPTHAIAAPITIHNHHPSIPQTTRRKANIASSCLASIPGFSADRDVTFVTLIGEDERSWARTINTAAVSAMNTTSNGDGDAHSTDDKAAFVRDTCMSASLQQQQHQHDYYYSYSRVKGFLYIDVADYARHNITLQYVGVSRSDTNCFGEPFLQRIVFSVVGPEVVMRNWLVALRSGSRAGYLYNPRTDSLIDVARSFPVRLPESLVSSASSSDALISNTPQHHNQQEDETNHRQHSWFQSSSYSVHQIIAKLTVVLKTSFLYFITTTLVSFTLRETQERMLDFTHQLHSLVRSGRPVVGLVTTHLIENLVFCPVMVGIIFFLIEFYKGDKILAFTVLSVVWLCEVFSVVRYVY